MASKKPAKPVTLTAEMRFVVLYGPEPMLQKLRLNQLRDALIAVHGPLDPIHIDGKSAQLADVFDEVREYSLLTAYKLVVLDDADQFIQTHRDALERYAAEPVDHATLVLRSDGWRSITNLHKLVEKVGAVIRCDVPSEAEARNWAIRRCQKEHQRVLQAQAADELVQRVGPHLMQIDAELAKLSLLVATDQPIEVSLVQRTVRAGSDEQAWAVQEAVLAALADAQAGPLIGKVHELVDLSGQAEVLVGYFVADLLRKLIVAQGMLAEGVSQDEVFKAFKMHWGERRRTFASALEHYDLSTLRHLLADILDSDARAKSGYGDSLRNLEGFCARLVDKIN
ncbi:MAG: DNA polymerase III subunit delta [Phycisphaeraceae bacterium]|nr:DNA polymerase III subunit delta [Phycisphaeraceae bacterium]